MSSAVISAGVLRIQMDTAQTGYLAASPESERSSLTLPMDAIWRDNGNLATLPAMGERTRTFKSRALRLVPDKIQQLNLQIQTDNLDDPSMEAPTTTGSSDAPQRRLSTSSKVSFASFSGSDFGDIYFKAEVHEIIPENEFVGRQENIDPKLAGPSFCLEMENSDDEPEEIPESDEAECDGPPQTRRASEMMIPCSAMNSFSPEKESISAVSTRANSFSVCSFGSSDSLVLPVGAFQWIHKPNNDTFSGAGDSPLHSVNDISPQCEFMGGKSSILSTKPAAKSKSAASGIEVLSLPLDSDGETMANCACDEIKMEKESPIFSTRNSSKNVFCFCMDMDMDEASEEDTQAGEDSAGSANEENEVATRSLEFAGGVFSSP